jgi:hypothetical protein
VRGLIHLYSSPAPCHEFIETGEQRVGGGEFSVVMTGHTAHEEAWRKP